MMLAVSVQGALTLYRSELLLSVMCVDSILTSSFGAQGHIGELSCSMLRHV